MPTSGHAVPVAPGDRGARPNILVVDDNPANLLAMEAALGDLGGHVVQASSGEESLRILLEHDFALVLLDVKMPLLGGFETARLIRERKRSRHTPIIFITAHSRDDEEVAAAYNLGAVDFLFKPFAAEVLRAKAAVFVELQRRTVEVGRQAELLREHERREHERILEQQKRRWEEESMRRQMKELADEAQRKDEFLAILGHELRNPLTPILAGLQLLGLRLADSRDAIVHRARARIERQVNHLRRLVDDLLDVSRINSGKIELRKAPVAIQEVLQDALSICRPAINERRHRLILQAPAEPLRLLADGVRLTQILANLVGNAAIYTDPGGQIDIRCTAGERWIEIAVADNGRGIDPQLLPRIFDLFIQARPGAGGLGLGLAVASRLAELHGGTISATSAGEGRGSEFILRLPAGMPVGDAADPPAAAPAGDRRPLVIAVVDDNGDIREAIQDLLVGVGHTVEVAGDGATGVELIGRLRPDVALVDISMPDLDGYEVAARIQAQLGSDRPRLVALSGHGLEAHRKRAHQAGFDAYLIKPCRLDTLLRSLLPEDNR
jgi:signal transduction histidine kinase